MSKLITSDVSQEIASLALSVWNTQEKNKHDGKKTKYNVKYVV